MGVLTPLRGVLSRPSAEGLTAISATTGGGLLNCSPKSLKTTPVFAVLSPCWAFFLFWGSLGKPKVEMNSKRRCGFWDFGGLYWTAVQELEVDLLAYLR